MTALARQTFVDFMRDELGVPLTLGQRTLARVCYDGANPCDLPADERAVALEMFGEVDRFPSIVRRVQAQRLGRGSGKSTLCAAGGVWRMLTADISSCGPGDVPTCVVVAPDKPTAKLSVRMAIELSKRSPRLASRIEAETSEGFTLRRPDGKRAAFEAFAAARGGASARGRSIIEGTIDEAEFMRSDSGSYVVTDRDVAAAILPRLIRGGTFRFLSTPWPVTSLAGELFDKNFGAPATALACRASTLVMRDHEPQLAADIAMELERDEENARREFFCESIAGGVDDFFASSAIEAAVDVSLALPIAPTNAHRISIGVDLAFERDASAICVVGWIGERVTLLALEEFRPTRAVQLVPSEVFDRFTVIAKEYGAKTIVSDVHYQAALREHLGRNGITLEQAPGGAEGKAQVHVAARTLLHEGRARIPRHQRLIAQLRGIRAAKTAGGGISIRSARRAGDHGDIASAFLLALYKASLGGGFKVKARVSGERPWASQLARGF